ncbi:MAG: GNAT family N-acetyltransferase [Flavobacteriales bacterium]|nr:GNAT family N-acetyltransferase [Flavobacteriales bacterium]
MIETTIRTCTQEDIHQIIGLMKELKAFASTSSDFIEEDINSILKEMEMKPDIYINLVAEINGLVVGFISVIFYKTLYHKGGTALINELIINQNYRDKGIGRLLVENIKSEAIRRGMDELEVGTELDNKVAQSFYKKCGFDEEFLLLGMVF